MRYEWSYIIVFKSCGHKRALKSMLFSPVWWHTPYCATLPAILSDKQSALSWGTRDGGRACAGLKHMWECISSPAVPSPSQRWKVNRASSHKPRSLYTSVPLLFQQHHNALWQLPSWRINMDSLQTHAPPPPPALCHSWVFKHWSSR